MSLTINTNLSSLIVQKSLLNSTLGLNQAIERMTTGFKINHAKDNAAGYSIVTNMGVKLSSYNVAMDNAAMGLDLITTASDSLDLISSHLQRMRDLAEQAANGTYGEDSLKAIQSELVARESEISRIIANTEYNGISLFENTDNVATNSISTFSSPKDVTVDESKRVVNQTSFQAGETYYITSSEDLVKLQDLVNGGADTLNVTFELANDIDMQGVSFRGIGKDYTNSFEGTFKGNQHIISNLTINTKEANVGLFGYTGMGFAIDSLGLENVNISGGDNVGGLIGRYAANLNDTIKNCYSNGTVSGNSRVGGLIGAALNGTIYNSYSAGTVIGTGDNVGGLFGCTEGGSIHLYNSYSTSNVRGKNNVGGLIGYNSVGSGNNCYSMGIVTGTGNIIGGLIGYGGVLLNNSYYDKEKSGQTVGVGSGAPSGITGVTTSELNALIANGRLPQYDYANTYGDPTTGGGNDNSGREFTIQVGIDSSDNSKITFSTEFAFANLSLDLTSAQSARDALTQIDEYIKQINEKQTELGSAYNRLDSAIESIGISIENLTSSRSTIRDADIAEESSEYIRNQILQQAAATLLATANQTPSIALQLL